MQTHRFPCSVHLSALLHADALLPSTHPAAASHEAHLNRMVHLGVVPPMLTRIVSAVDQVLLLALGCQNVRAGGFVLPSAGGMRLVCIACPASFHSSHLPALLRLFVHCRPCKTSRRAGACSSPCCARWATWRQAAARRRWTSSSALTPPPRCKRWSPVHRCACDCAGSASAALAATELYRCRCCRCRYRFTVVPNLCPKLLRIFLTFHLHRATTTGCSARHAGC